MPILPCGDAHFRVEIDGPEGAPVLLFSNSLSCDLTMWEAQVAALSDRYRVIRYDGRGQGGSVLAPGPPITATPSPAAHGHGAYTMAQLGRDAIAVLDGLGVERAHFCGLSMGGMVGMWLLTHAAGRLDRVVLANTSAHMPPKPMWDDRIALARSGGMEATVEPTVTRWFPPGFRRHAPEVIEHARVMIRGTSVDGYAACCAAIRDMDQRDALHTAVNPVLVLVGARDPATTPAAGQLIHEAIAGSTLVTLDTGHISAMERPDEFSDVVGRFLAA